MNKPIKILLTGATGYIGKRLLESLVRQGHHVTCCARNRERVELMPEWTTVDIFEVDFMEEVDLNKAPLDFDVAFYLIHSLSSTGEQFEEAEQTTARNFTNYVNASSAQQIIYLSGIVNVEDQELSPHLRSRFRVEQILAKGNVPLTTLRAGIIVGSGSASFEIIRDLVEKLPIMIAPRWLNTRCQPVAIRNVLQFLTRVMLRPDCMRKNFDIGCKEILTYKEMLLGYARVRNLNRWIFTVPVMTPKLSSYWLYFITSTSYPLAVKLVHSMKVDVIARPNDLAERLNIELIPYQQAVEMAFEKIEQNAVISSWKDALSSSYEDNINLFDYVEVPKFGVYTDHQRIPITHNSVEQVLQNIWSIGGKRGWYFGNFLWKIRGFLDKLVGGVGLRRGRTNPDHIYPGDALDFWRVLVADPQKQRLLLYAEMKLPGEAWLEFKIDRKDGQHFICQTATFRPDGIAGRLYWNAVLPFHFFVFGGMIRNIERYKPSDPPRGFLQSEKG